MEIFTALPHKDGEAQVESEHLPFLTYTLKHILNTLPYVEEEIKIKMVKVGKENRKTRNVPGLTAVSERRGW